MQNSDFKTIEEFISINEKNYLNYFYNLQKRYKDNIKKLQVKYLQKETLARQSGIEFSKRKKMIEDNKISLQKFYKKPKPFRQILNHETFEAIQTFGLELFIAMYYDDIII